MAKKKRWCGSWAYGKPIIASYYDGYCPIFALALAKRFNLDLLGLEDLPDHDHWQPVLIHVVVDVGDGTVIDALGTADQDTALKEWDDKLGLHRPNWYNVPRKEFVATDDEIDALIKYIDKHLHIYAPGSPYRGNVK